MTKYVTQVLHLGNGDSFEYVNYDGTWFRYGKNIQNEGWKYKENEKLWIDWQSDFADHNYSYGELAYFSDYFETKARRYGLVKEFKENGII